LYQALYGKSQQLADSAKAHMSTKGVTWSEEIIWRDKRDRAGFLGMKFGNPGPINSADMLTQPSAPRDLSSINLVEVKMQLGTVPNLNKTLCAFTQLYDSGCDEGAFR